MPHPPPPASRDWHAQVATLARPLHELPDPLPIPVLLRPFSVSIRPPGSKSLTNRALLLAALSGGTSTLLNPLTEADDAKVMLRALRTLGAGIPPDPSGSILSITGTQARWRPSTPNPTLNLNNAGTATRFLAAAALLAPPGTSITIDGDARMRERPIAELTRALIQLGAKVEHLAHPDCPPIRITPPADLARLSDCITFPTTASSQFISALLLVAPFLPNALTITFDGPVTSPSYIHMTLALLRQVGVRVEGAPPGTIRVHPITHLPPFTLDIEPDASGATYFEAAAALSPTSTLTIDALSRVPPRSASDSSPAQPLQGDTLFTTFLEAIGCPVSGPYITVRGPASLLPIDFDLADMPDTAMTAAVLACFASPTPTNPTATTTLRGLRTLRVKETDRLAALQTELTKIGATVTITPDHHDESLVITPPPPHSLLAPSASPITFDTYHDHRMAMALALVGLRRPNILIANPGCVAKTYPTFFQHLATLYT